MRPHIGFIRLFLLLIATPLIVWAMALRPTIAQWSAYRTERSQTRPTFERTATDSLTTPQIPKWHEDILDNGEWLREVSHHMESNGVRVDGYVPYLTDRRSDIVLKSAEIVLQGNFVPLLKTIHALEREIPQVSLRSVRFLSKTEPQKKGKKLQVHLIVQQISRTSP